MAKISDLVFDDKNFNKHTEFGMSLIEKSLRKNGAGRSILIDKNNRIIAGNGVTEIAGQIGLDDVQIIETDGTKLIAVKRTDIDLDTKQGREMALADNATAAVDLDWDTEAIADVSAEFDIEAGEWGVVLDEDENESTDLSGSVETMYQIAIDCDNEQQQETIYNELKDKYKCRVLTL